MVRVGVFLSGCGFLDGAEIREAVLTLLHLDQCGAEAVCISIDQPQSDVVAHLPKPKPMAGEQRNVLVESGRIARGDIHDAAQVQAAQLDALIFPGGFGVAKNLCSFASAGADAKPHPKVAALVREMWRAKKPIGAICIAPALIASIFRDQDVEVNLTIGDDQSTAAALCEMGAKHTECPVTDFVVDAQNRIVSTPAYMDGKARLKDISQGIERLVKQVLELAGPRR